MHGEINVRLLTTEARRVAETMKRIQQREDRANDPERLDTARKITAKIHKVIRQYQHHQLTQAEAAHLVYALESQLPS